MGFSRRRKKKWTEKIERTQSTMKFTLFVLGEKEEASLSFPLSLSCVCLRLLLAVVSLTKSGPSMLFFYSAQHTLHPFLFFYRRSKIRI